MLIKLLVQLELYNCDMAALVVNLLLVKFLICCTCVCCLLLGGRNQI